MANAHRRRLIRSLLNDRMPAGAAAVAAWCKLSSRNGHCVRSDMAPRPDAGAGDQVANSRRLINMDSSTKNKAKGSLNEAKGKIKEGTGKVTENRDLEERGVAEKTGGKVEKKVGDVKKVFNK
jgi:uncharacterized protein YjbJ (UPF0337 family)